MVETETFQPHTPTNKQHDLETDSEISLDIKDSQTDGVSLDQISIGSPQNHDGRRLTPTSPSKAGLELPVTYRLRSQQVDNALTNALKPLTSEINLNLNLQTPPQTPKKPDSRLDEQEKRQEYELITIEQPKFEIEDELPLPTQQGSTPSVQIYKSRNVLNKMSEIDAHLLSLEEIPSKFETDFSIGLTSEQASERLLRDGRNVLLLKQSQHPFVTYVLSLFEGFGPVLWGSGVLCMIAWRVDLGDSSDVYNLALGILLFVITLLQGTFGYYQQRKSSKLMEILKQVIPTRCVVRRDGRDTEIDAQELVVGDMVNLRGGFKVPADVRIVEIDTECKVDYSLLTGESEPQCLNINSTSPNPFETLNLAFFGTVVVEGTARGVVVATSNKTVTGRLAKLVSDTKVKQAHVQREINQFAILIVIMAMIVGAIIIIAWAAWLRVKFPTFLTTATLLVTVVSVMVAFLPDGMPLSVLTTMMLIAKRMLGVKVLVKTLPVVETLGSATTILTDKTGTLTENRMTVSNVWTGGSFIPITDSTTRQLEDTDDSLLFHQLRTISVLCNRAVLDSKGVIIGDASEAALLSFYQRTSSDGIDSETVRSRYPKLGEIPFNSKNKWQSSIHNDNETDEKILYLKGAPEKILQRCTTILQSDGKTESLNKEMIEMINNAVIALGSKGERVLGLSFKHLKSHSASYSEDAILGLMNGLCFVGLVSMSDPIRTSVPPAISKCAIAGIRVIMVTGDHASTAEAIGIQAGILSKNNPERNVVIQGSEITNFSSEDWDRLMDRKVFPPVNIVFARTTPQDKLTIVQEAQRRGHSVAMLGDGVNDAPALKQANIGVAMGTGGSDVAREAASMLLIDNDFASLIRGIEEGRLLFENIKKVIFYLLPAGSFSEIIPVFANIFLGLPLPLSSFLMIVICLCTDVLPSLSLVYERAERDIMNLKPRDLKTQKLVNWQLICSAYFYVGVMESLVGFLNYFLVMYHYGVAPHDLIFAFSKWGQPDFHGLSVSQQSIALSAGQTAFFVGLVFMQFFNGQMVRTKRMSIFSQPVNWRMFCAVLVDIGIVLFVSLAKPLNNVFSTYPIPWYCFFIPILCGMFMLGIDEIRKFIIRNYQFKNYKWSRRQERAL